MGTVTTVPSPQRTICGSWYAATTSGRSVVVVVAPRNTGASAFEVKLAVDDDLLSAIKRL